MKQLFTLPILMTSLVFFVSSCSNNNKKQTVVAESEIETNKETVAKTKYPSDVIPFLNQWKILLGDGNKSKDLINYEKEGFFYDQNDGKADWIVYKTPNSGTTSKTSSNTRTELHQKNYWQTETGGKLTGTLKVMHVSTSGDPRVAASYSVVVGQIHGNDGHKNEPLKICYKKFPGHSKGSVYWNYEINTVGDTKEDNKGRWDFSSAIWGYDMFTVGDTSTTYPEEPVNGIALGEEFSYEVNVYEGIMYLTFKSEGHETKTFTKNLLVSEFAKKSDIPKQIQDNFFPIGQDGIEKPTAYKGEENYFKQGAYNQTNGKDPKKNMVWATGAEIYGGDIAKQYANGSYAEVWFKEASVGASTAP